MKLGPLSHVGRRSRSELIVLSSLFFVCLFLWGFAELADEVMEGETHAFDEAVLLALRAPDDSHDPLGPLWLEEVGRDYTALGGMGVLTLLVASAGVYLLVMRRPRMALFVVVAVAGGTALSFGLKEVFDRPRPDLVPHLSHVSTSSFPSGHSMMSAVTYLTLFSLLARAHSRSAARIFLMIWAILLTLLVGTTRVYLGVHWPTDVAAGWTAGAVWALLSWNLARYLQRRGNLESIGIGRGDPADEDAAAA